MTIKALYPEILPSLNLDFARVKALDPRITFARASSATYYGTRTVKAEENLLLRSQELDTSATWLVLNSVMTPNTTTAPDGTTTAETLLETTATGTHRFRQALPAGTYTVSIFVKPNGRDFFSIANTDGSPEFATFDLSAGTVDSTSGGVSNAQITASTQGFFRVSVTIPLTANGAFFHIRNAGGVPTSYAGDATLGVFVWGAQAEARTTLTAYTATTTQPITRYIPVLETAASGVARFDHSPTTGESLGFLVEEQRTNLVLRSEEFDNASWTKTASIAIVQNSQIAPDGVLSMDSLVDSGNASKRILQATTSIASATYTLSVYAKEFSTGAKRYLFMSLSSSANTSTYAQARFDVSNGTVVFNGASGTGLSISSFNAEDVGNGVYRCFITGTIGTNTDLSVNIGMTASATNITPETRGSQNYTGDGYSGIYIWGAQLEAGAFPTSYIKTVASQVTRSADAASMTGANFSSWYRQDEGTLYAEGVNNIPNATVGIVSLDDGTISNRMTLRRSASTLSCLGVSGGVTQWNNTNGVWSTGQQNKAVLSFKTNNVVFILSNSSNATLDTECVIPNITTLRIGSEVAGAASPWSGTVAKIAYYPKASTATQLQALATP
jgi:hypothetical protein